MLMKLIVVLIFVVYVAWCKHQSIKQCARATNAVLLNPKGTEEFYDENSITRQDITGGKSGIPLRIAATVLDVNTCLPAPNAVVSLWQCDAVGICPPFVSTSKRHKNPKSDSTTFLQGQQITDGNGVVFFDSIYPGWYFNRAAHIHVKVHIGDTSTILNRTIYAKDDSISYTGQLYFDDHLTDKIATVFPYSTNNIRRTRNEDDEIYFHENGSIKILSIQFLTDELTEGMKTKITLVIGSASKSTVLQKSLKAEKPREYIKIPTRKRIALVAHDSKKMELIDCLKQYRQVLSQNELFGTGSTGSLVEKELKLTVTKFRSGPLGGDQQLGAMIASQQLDILFFLIDPLFSHPHIVDIQALLRLAEVWNIVSATTVTSIQFILTSPKMNESITRQVYLAPATPATVKREEKPASLQRRRVPIISDKLKFILSHLSSKR